MLFKKLGIHLALLAGVIILFELTNIDLVVQDHFYRQDLQQWVIDRHEPVMHFIFYTGPKVILITLGTCCIILSLLSIKHQQYKPFLRNCLLISLSLMLVPLCISGLKKVSRVHTPEKTIRYGGKVPYVKVFEKYPAGTRPLKVGRGWPAGHASGGFSLMILAFVFQKPRNKKLGLLTGLVAGWAMGLYQTLNGQHFLSHTLISMQLSWMIILSINALLIMPPEQIKKTDLML